MYFRCLFDTSFLLGYLCQMVNVVMLYKFYFYFCKLWLLFLLEDSPELKRDCVRKNGKNDCKSDQVVTYTVFLFVCFLLEQTVTY